MEEFSHELAQFTQLDQAGRVKFHSALRNFLDSGEKKTDGAYVSTANPMHADSMRVEELQQGDEANFFAMRLASEFGVSDRKDVPIPALALVEYVAFASKGEVGRLLVAIEDAVGK